MGTKISALGAADALTGTEELAVVQGGVTKKVAASELGGGITLRSAIGSGSSNRTLTSTTYVDLADMVVSIPAVAGDVLDIAFLAPMYHGTNIQPIWARINVGGNDVGAGMMKFFTTANSAELMSLLVAHTVLAGDISGGNVTVKVRWRLASGTATALNESTADNRRPSLIVRNMGPQ